MVEIEIPKSKTLHYDYLGRPFYSITHLVDERTGKWFLTVKSAPNFVEPTTFQKTKTLCGYLLGKKPKKIEPKKHTFVKNN